MVDFLDSVSLQDLVDQQKERLAQQGTLASVLHDSRPTRRTPVTPKPQTVTS
jgi:hypothetical protein